jgi:hypothetical protein
VKIKRKDGKVLTFAFVSHGRGECAAALVKVNDQHADCYTDPDFKTQRAARRYARQMADRYAYVCGLGWCVP